MSYRLSDGTWNNSLPCIFECRNNACQLLPDIQISANKPIAPSQPGKVSAQIFPAVGVMVAALFELAAITAPRVLFLFGTVVVLDNLGWDTYSWPDQWTFNDAEMEKDYYKHVVKDGFENLYPTINDFKDACRENMINFEKGTTERFKQGGVGYVSVNKLTRLVTVAKSNGQIIHCMKFKLNSYLDRYLKVKTAIEKSWSPMAIFE